MKRVTGTSVRQFSSLSAGQGEDRFAAPRKAWRWNPIAWTNYWRKYEGGVSRLFCAGDFLEAIAEKSWQVEAGGMTVSRAAFFLPGQLERVTGMAYTDDPGRDMRGGITTLQPPTRAYLLTDVTLLDGSLYKRDKRLDMHARMRLSKIARYIPRMRVEDEVEQAAIYSSYDGNEFFGLWLTDDCPNYLLAKEAGVPVTALETASPHMLEYEARLGMTPLRTGGALLHKATLFDDRWGNNPGKHGRLGRVRERLLAGLTVKPHPGVFILRRDSGKRRTMHNEVELAEYLRERWGFSIADVTREDAASILAKCAGARVVAGVEGSHLMHGLMVLEQGASVLTLQPPDRFCGVIKRTSDMEYLNYGFVVGRAEEGGFRADVDEVERTLDLFPQSTGFGVPAVRVPVAMRTARAMATMRSHARGKSAAGLTA
jgi:hypothetical protein